MLEMPRDLQSTAQPLTWDMFSESLGLFFGLQFLFFSLIPGMILLSRFLRNPRGGVMVMFRAPVGRVGDKRSPASALRFFLFQETSLGYWADVAQALFSAISCIMFITVAYSAYDPEILQDVEFFFTTWFVCDYATRLYIAQDSLSFFFSGVSLLDFITVIPAIVTWLMSGLSSFETNIQVIVQCIRVMRVFRIFRVIRVIRVVSVSQTYAFQRQVTVLVLTVLSLVFAAAGLYQIMESAPGQEYPFQKAVYYAAITVIGRPGVPFTSVVTPVFLTALGLAAATIIPTFVAELIRLWYDNTALDRYAGNPESPHVIVCGDNNASRLRVLVGQMFHPSRSPNRTAPLVILHEGKPEGALRALLEEHKHSGNVAHVRGTGRRVADLARAGAAMASTVVVLNYRADREAGAADTDVISTVMAVKKVKPGMRVIAQLHRPRKRNALRLVPGWKEGDKAVAASSIGMTLVGLSTHLPGFSTLVTNLLRRSTAGGGGGKGGMGGGSGTGTGTGSGRGGHGGFGASNPLSHAAGEFTAGVMGAWNTLMYGAASSSASSASSSFQGRDVDSRTGRIITRSPMEEYGLSMEAGISECVCPPGLEGVSFAAAARAAYLRHGILLLGANVPVNEALGAQLGSPRTYRAAFFPALLPLRSGMTLYAIVGGEGGGGGGGEEALETWMAENGGQVRSALVQAVESVQWNPFQTMLDNDSADAAASANSGAGSGNPHSHATSAAAAAAANRRRTHNIEAARDVAVPWDWSEMDWEGESYTSAFLALLNSASVGAGMGAIGGGGGGGASSAAASGGVGRGATPAPASSTTSGSSSSSSGGGAPSAPSATLDFDALFKGAGILQLDIPGEAIARALAHGKGPVIGPLPPSTPSGGGSNASVSVASHSSSSPAPLGHEYDPFAGEAGLSSSSSSSTTSSAPPPATNLAPPVAAATASTSSPPQPNLPSQPPTTSADPAATAATSSSSSSNLSLLPRKASLGDDGFGGIDDTDDVVGDGGGPLVTCPPPSDSATGAAAAARLASSASTAALAVRLALPSAALSSEDLTLVMPTATGTGRGGTVVTAAAALSTSKPAFSNHVIVCGSADAMGFLLRGVASLLSARQARGGDASNSSSSDIPPTFKEGDQFSFLAGEVVLLSPSKPSGDALNAMYSGTSTLLSKVTHIQGSPSDPVDLLKACIMSARAAVILTTSKPTASADGGDNLSDDTETIMATAVMYKLNPRLHTITELLHGTHAPYIRPTGAGLNDAQRSSFAYVLEEREAWKQKGRVEEAIRGLQLEVSGAKGRGVPPKPVTLKLLGKLLAQQTRLALLHPTSSAKRSSGSGGGGGGDAGIAVRATDSLQGGRLGGMAGRGEGDIDAAFSGLTTSDIVDVIVGVREDLNGGGGGGGGGGVSAAANDGASFSSGGGGGGGGGSGGGVPRAQGPLMTSTPPPPLLPAGVSPLPPWIPSSVRGTLTPTWWACQSTWCGPAGRSAWSWSL